MEPNPLAPSESGPIVPGELVLSGGAPIALPARSACWRVTDGSVEAYLAWPNGRRMVTVAGPGALLFGIAGGSSAAAALSLVAPGGARLEQTTPEFDELCAGADAWVHALVRGVSSRAPEATFTLDAAAMLAVEDGEILTAEQHVLWLSSGPGPVLDFNLTGEMVLAPDVIGLAGSLFVQVRGRGDVRVRTTADLGSQRIPDAVSGLAQAVTAVFDQQNAATDAQALRRLTGLPGTDDARAESGIDSAFARLWQLHRIPIAERPILPAGAEAMPTSALARISGFRARKITLEPGWHRRDHGALLIRKQSEGSPLEALIWDGRCYSSDVARVTEADAAAYRHAAHAISAALPLKIKGIWSLAYHVMRSGNSRDAGLAAAAAAGVALIGILTPLATSWLLSDIVPSGAAGLLIAVGIALACGALVSSTLGIARTVATTRIEGRGATVLAAALTDRILRLPTRFFKEFSAGDLNQRLQNVDQMRQLAVSIVMSAGLTAILSIVYLGVLFYYDTNLALIGLALVAVYIVAVIIARVLQMEAIREAASLDGEIAGLTYETLEGVGKLRASAAEERAMERWLDVYRRERAAGVRAGRVGVNFGAFADTYQTVTLMALFAGAGALSALDASAGVFIGFLAAFGSFQGAFVGLSQALLQIYSAQPLVERARPILEAAPEVDPGRSDPGILKGAIEGSGLTFAYAEGLPPVLNNLSFEVRPGEHMAIVGGSGSGKSTLLRVLLGFETPQRGSILYDGQDLARLDLTRVRSQIGVVLQASQLFAGSILENVRGATSTPLEDCLKAVERAGLARDLQVFAMGIHTPITEGAGTLSGGQRQRILIARALAANPNILFFDEATSALDNATQAIVSHTLDLLKVTRITIAHRLSTVRNADRICVLQDGKFIEQGTFDELMTLDGAFTALARRQLTEE